MAGADLRLVMLTTSAISRYSDAGHPSNGQRISLRIHLHAVRYCIAISFYWPPLSAGEVSPTQHQQQRPLEQAMPCALSLTGCNHRWIVLGGPVHAHPNCLCCWCLCAGLSRLSRPTLTFRPAAVWGGVEREGNLLLRPASARRNCPAPMTHPRAYITLSPSRVYSVLLSPVALALAL